MFNRFLAACATLLLFIPAAEAQQRGGYQPGWVSTWATGVQVPLFAEPAVVNNQTVRQIVRISRGGDSVRVRLSNALGTTPLTINAASIGVRGTDASLAQGTGRALRFGAKPSITIPPGSIVVSDPVRLRVRDEADLAISIFVANPTTVTTEHTNALQTSYVSAAGDFTASEAFEPAATFTAWYWLSGVEVRRSGGSIVAFGDSITEGYGSTTDGNARYPDFLARKLIDAGDSHAVVDTGIGGNRVLNDEIGPNALSRLDRDLLTVSGADYAILLEAINDIGLPLTASQPPQEGAPSFPPSVSTAEVSADDIIAGYQQIALRAHDAGITIFIATLTPIGGSFYDTEATEAKRQAVNAWIRENRVFDGVIDFDKAVQDPDAPQKILAEYDSGDALHPNDAGYEAMANAIDVSLFRPRARRAVAAGN